MTMMKSGGYKRASVLYVADLRRVGTNGELRNWLLIMTILQASFVAYYAKRAI